MGALRHLRFPVERDLRRRYPELPHPYRTDFQRDRDRVIHSHAFRRLEDKTQVFTTGVSDHFRTRLTHTLEVTQIARTVASVLELNSDFTEVLALAHDVGHPPFAHAGEDELRRQMQAFGDNFDHNLHALRIVERFEHRYARFPGLNLTFEVREGMVKHSHDFDPGDNPVLDEFLPGLRPPLEAQLIDVCDEVAYNSADLDDAHAAGFISMDQMREGVPLFANLYEEIEMQFPGATEQEQFCEIQRALINTFVTGLIAGTAKAAVDANVMNVDDVRKHSSRLAAFDPTIQGANLQIKQLLRKRVYESPAVVAERGRSMRDIGQLFQFFLADPTKLPANYQEAAEAQPLHRVICDYIAGMTDGFFRRTYRGLIG